VRFLTPHVSVLWVFPASGAIVENEAHAIWGHDVYLSA
jgi:hypothetical protein